MWLSHLPKGQVTLLSGGHGTLTAFHHELIHDAVHDSPHHVLVLDGAHCFNPYDVAELNLIRAKPADHGADRILVRRAMTPFQWHNCLSRELDRKLMEVEASLVLAVPYDHLFHHDEIQDWEQEDYVRHSLHRLTRTARLHHVPVVLTVDMARLSKSHPFLAQAITAGVTQSMEVQSIGAGWRLLDARTRATVAESRRWKTLQDFVEEAPQPVPVMPRPGRRAFTAPRPPV